MDITWVSIVVPIVVAIVANGTTVAVLLESNRAARKREETRLDREDARLETARHDQRVHWARDNNHRLATLRQGPHIEFYQELREGAKAIHDAGYGFTGALVFDWNLPAYEALLRLEVFATRYTYNAGDRAYNALYAWGHAGPKDYESEEEIAFDDARDLFLIAARHDLAIEMDENRLDADSIIS